MATIESGTRTNAFDGQSETETWEYKFDSDNNFTGGFEVKAGLRVNLDENWAPTGDFVTETGETLSIPVMVNIAGWTHSGDAIQSWEDGFLNGSAEQTDKDAYTALPAEEKVAFFATSLFELAMSDLDSDDVTQEYLLDDNDNLIGIKATGPNYGMEFTGDLQTNGDPDDPSVVGGTIHSGKIYQDGNLISDGSNSFELPATVFGQILEAIGFDDDHDSSGSGVDISLNDTDNILSVNLPETLTVGPSVELFDGQNDYQVLDQSLVNLTFDANGNGVWSTSYSNINAAIQAFIDDEWW